MAFAATATWEVAATGSDGNAGADTNGGGFDPGNASMATDLTTDTNTGNTSSPVVSSASYNFQARDVGHWLFIKAGTNWLPGWYKIASVASNKATLSAAIGAAVLWATGGAYSVSTAAGVASTGTPTGGTWSIDYSQCGTGLAFSDLVQASTTTCTSAAMPMGKNFVGNIFTIVSGTGTWTAQRLQINSVTGTTATVDKTLGGTGGTGGTGVMGGCLASPGMASGLHVSGNKVWLKNGTYTLTSSTADVSGGRVVVKSSNSTSLTVFDGYDALRTDSPTGSSRPTITASGISSFQFFLVASTSAVRHLIVDGASLTTSRGIRCNNPAGEVSHVTAKNCTNSGFAGGDLYFCDATGCTTQPAFTIDSSATPIRWHYCTAWSNSVTGFDASNGSVAAVGCLSVNNSGASSDGFLSNTSATAWELTHCTAYNNGRDGFRFVSGICTAYLLNCLSYANTGTNFNVSAASDCVRLRNCAAGLGGVSSANVSSSLNLQGQVGNITLTADPFTAKGSGDFSLNNTAGGGALCRAAGFSAAMPGVSTSSYRDVGAAQTQGGGGGSVAFSPFNSPVIRGVA